MRYKPRPEWVMLREDREKALAKRAVSNMEKLDHSCRVLPKLAVGDSVLVQNQVGNHPSRWDITGVVVEVEEHDQYVVKVDGSGRMTTRNRKFLKKITPYSMTKHFRQDDARICPPTPAPPPVTTPAPPPVSTTALPPAEPAAPEPSPSPPASPSEHAPDTAPAPMTPDIAPAPVSPEPEPVRRSARVSRAPDRLKVTHGTKTYAQAVSGTDPDSISIRDNFPRLDPGWGGGHH